MKLFFILISIIFLQSISLFAQSNTELYDSLFDHYAVLNDLEERMPEYKDDTIALRQKIVQLDLINKSRLRYRAAPVQLDILACRLANKNSMDAAKNGYTSHWNLQGETPYQRWYFAGGVDHISENAFGQRTNKTYEISSRVISELMRVGHLSFMAERNPNDGHKENIIDKHHNYVGIGFFLTAKQFNYYEEFIDRYLEFENIPSRIKTKEEFSITLSVPSGLYLYFLSVSMDNFPQAMSAAILNRKGTYNDYGSRVIENMEPWDLAALRKENEYTLHFKFNKTGLYYVQLFLHNKELLKPGSYSTKGKIQASGLLIKVSE